MIMVNDGYSMEFHSHGDPPSSLDGLFLVENPDREKWDVQGNGFLMAWGYPKSSIWIGVSLINHPAIGVPTSMETTISDKLGDKTLVGGFSPPLWKIWVRQLRWLDTHYWKNLKMFQTTNQQ